MPTHEVMSLVQRKIVLSPKICKIVSLLTFDIKDKTFPTNFFIIPQFALKFELLCLHVVMTP